MPLASRIAAFEVVSYGVRRGGLVEHDRLLVRDADGRPVPVAWRVVRGVAHVDAGAGPEERGRALALAGGRWSHRAQVIAGLRGPDLGRMWAAEAELDPAAGPPATTPADSAGLAREGAEGRCRAGDPGGDARPVGLSAGRAGARDASSSRFR